MKIKISPTSAQRSLEKRLQPALGQASPRGNGSRTIPPFSLLFCLKLDSRCPVLLWRQKSVPFMQGSRFQAAGSSGVDCGCDTGEISKGSRAIKTGRVLHVVPAAGWRAGEGNGAGWVWSVCLKNTLKKKKVCPLQRSPFTCDSLLGREGTKRLSLKTGEQSNQKPP